MRSDTVIAPGVVQTIAVEDGNLVTGFTQDCDPIREDAQARHKAGIHGGSDMKHAARLPMWAIEKYLHVHGITMHEFSVDKSHLRAMCNDPALKDFRIWPGAL